MYMFLSSSRDEVNSDLIGTHILLSYVSIFGGKSTSELVALVIRRYTLRRAPLAPYILISVRVLYARFLTGYDRCSIGSGQVLGEIDANHVRVQ